LLFIVGRRRHALPHDQLQPRLHGRLRIVALHQTIAALHQARFRVGEIVLLFIRGLRLLHLRAWLSGLLRLLPRAFLQRPFRRANLLQPGLAPLQLCG
jgi:hypothetical protein